jgi:hypothetical protein
MSEARTLQTGAAAAARSGVSLTHVSALASPPSLRDHSCLVFAPVRDSGVS